MLAIRRQIVRPSGDLPVPGAFVFTARNEVFTQGNAPTAAEIEGALRNVQTTANTSPAAAAPLGLGNWVGPRARITRTAVLLSTGGRVTNVAWLFQFPDDSTPDAAGAQRDADRFNRLLSQATTNLQHLPRSGGNWADFALIPYEPSANGSIAWWQNGGPGGAGDTATRDGFALGQQVGQNAGTDNPIGPTTQRPPDLAAPPLVRDLTGLLVAAGVVAGLVYFGPPLARAVGDLIPERKHAS